MGLPQESWFSPFRGDETRNAELNGDRNPEWWGDFSQLHIQIKQKSQVGFVPQDTSDSQNWTSFNPKPSRTTCSIVLTQKLRGYKKAVE